MGDTLAGKTTHGKWLAKDHGALYISSGEIARSLMDETTKSNFNQGGLSPHDELIIQTIRRKIVEYDGKCVILDGFPRMQQHRQAIEDWYQTYWPAEYPCAVLLDVPFDIILRRSHDRSRDSFDTPEIAAKRHEVFARETVPVFNSMERDRWLKFAVRIKSETETRVVHNFIEKTFIAYAVGQTIIK